MLDYKLIEALAMVVRERGFEKAAQKLFLTQSAVSQRIKLLEDQTGQVLLSRTNPPRATSAGQRILKHYLQVKRLEEDLLDVLAPAESDDFIELAVGINRDSIATWFMEAVQPFLSKERVLLDLRCEDQEQTHILLKDGEVIGCISAKDQPMQGCRVDYLGRMDYRLTASPDFAGKWFPNGLTPEAFSVAPAIIFNRKDELHARYLKKYFSVELQTPAHYVPSSEKFADFIASDLAYGMLPDQQSRSLLETGELIDLNPGAMLTVNLYWHCWNLKSDLLDAFSKCLISGARKILDS